MNAHGQHECGEGDASVESPATPMVNTRENGWRSCCALLTVMLVACGKPERPGVPANNLMLVTVAGLRADHTSAYLYPRPTTFVHFDGGLKKVGRALAIDDLVAEGVLYANAFAPSSSAYPSLASLLTGRSPLATGVLEENTPIPDTETTLAEAFADAGFLTAAFVAGNGVLPPAGLEQGFESYHPAVNDAGALGAAVQFVSDHDFGSRGPLFLWLHLTGPSFPYEPGSVPGEGGTVDCASLFTDPEYTGPADGSAAFRAAAQTLDEADREHIIGLYDGEVAMMNRMLLWFLDYFHWKTAPADAWSSTVFVLAGTTGEELFRDGETWGHTNSAHDSVLRVPLFIRHPDTLTGRRILAEVVDLTDVMPTLLDWFDVPAPSAVSGRTLLPTVDTYVDQSFERRPAFSVQGNRESFTVRTPEWRLVLRPAASGASGGDAVELYHERVDPHALHDVALVNPDVALELERLMRAWIAAGGR
jgi:arylsulfatase A-like enzyme